VFACEDEEKKAKGLKNVVCEHYIVRADVNQMRLYYASATPSLGTPE